MTSIKPISLGDISVTFVEAILKTLESLGHSRTTVCSKYHLSQSFLQTPDARVSIPKFMRIGYDAIRICGVDHFGLLVGQQTSICDIGPAGFSAMAAPTLGQSLKTLIEFETISSSNSRGRSRYLSENGRNICQFYSVSPYNAYNYFVVDSTLSSWLSIGRWLSQKQLIVHHVEVEYAQPRYKEHYEQLFKCPVYFGAARNALVLNDGASNLPNHFASAANFHAMRHICEQKLADLEKGKTLKDRVEELITEELSGVTPSIHDIASRMGLAGWTLRRRLANEGLHFRRILDETRQALAFSYVRDTQHNFTEIAFLLGFSTPAAFQRAFKRWSGISPGEFRKNALDPN